jgi:hypothetical protein
VLFAIALGLTMSLDALLRYIASRRGYPTSNGA